MENPLVSVIIPVYNGKKYISETIESVLGQTYAPIEIIIIDDGSKDSSHNVIKPYLNDNKIKYYFQQNQGVAAARNFGIQKSSGNLIAFIDQDDLWLPEKISRQVSLMSTNSQLALVHGRIEFINENGTRIKPLWTHPEVSGYCFKEMFSGNKIAMLTALVKKESIMAAGMFDETIAITDDYDLWLKISYTNMVGYVDETIALYRYHGENTSGNIVAFKKNELQVLQNFLKKHPEIQKKISNKIIKDRLFNVIIELCKISIKRNNRKDFNLYSKLAFKIFPFKFLSSLPRIYSGYFLYVLKEKPHP